MVRRWLRPAAFPLLIFALNFYFVHELYSLEYSQFMGSIEAAYISISRYMIENWRDLTWFPLWYGGIPFQNTYPPFLHALVALAAVLFRMSPAHAHHFVTALFYCLAPVALYALALRLTGSRWGSFWAAWIYSILSPSLFLMPSVRADLGGLFGLRRFQALLPYGEGPHITSMALLPIALLGLDLALSKRTPLRCTFAAVAIAAVVLSNWLGAFALAARDLRVSARTYQFLGCVADVAQRGAAMRARLRAGLLLDPAFHNSRHPLQRSILSAVPSSTSTSTCPCMPRSASSRCCRVKFAMRQRKISDALQFFVLFALVASSIPLAAQWARVNVVPQPLRYHLEMDLALSLPLAFGFRAAAGRLSHRYRTALVVLLLALSFFPARIDRRYARLMIKPVNIFDTVEYKTAKWFDAHLDGGRVMAAGSVSYWMNAFTDTPQFGGGFDQGITNRTYNAVSYQLLSAEGAGDRAAEIASLWLEAYGVQAIAVREPFRHPEVFEQSFGAATHVGDEAIYWVPERNIPFARVIASENLVQDRPVNGIDIARLQAYVHAIRDPQISPSSFRWTSRHSAEIQAEVHREQVISVPITYHPGWHALVNHMPRRLFGDGLGQIVVEPGCDGLCNLQLVYDGGTEMLIARALSWSSAAGCLLWIILKGRR